MDLKRTILFVFLSLCVLCQVTLATPLMRMQVKKLKNIETPTLRARRSASMDVVSPIEEEATPPEHFDSSATSFLLSRLRRSNAIYHQARYQYRHRHRNHGNKSNSYRRRRHRRRHNRRYGQVHDS